MKIENIQNLFRLHETRESLRYQMEHYGINAAQEKDLPDEDKKMRNRVRNILLGTISQIDAEIEKL